MLPRHSYSACQLLRCTLLPQRQPSLCRILIRVRAFQSDEAAGQGESERKSTTVKRKVAMHVAYCGTGYQGIRYIYKGSSEFCYCPCAYTGLHA